MLVYKYFKISVILILEPLEECSGLDDIIWSCGLEFSSITHENVLIDISSNKCPTLSL